MRRILVAICILLILTGNIFAEPISKDVKDLLEYDIIDRNKGELNDININPINQISDLLDFKATVSLDSINVEFSEVIMDFNIDTIATAYNLLDGSTDGYQYAPHGMVVDPDGKIWIGFHYGYSRQFERAIGDTITLRSLHCFMPDGSPASFSPIEFLEFEDGSKDTIYAESAWNGSCKGVTAMDDGSILMTSWMTVYKIDYQTGEGIARWYPAMDGQTPTGSMTEVAHDPEMELIYMGYVGASKPIYMLDENLGYVGIAVDNVPTLQRSILTRTKSDGVSQIFLGTIWNGQGIFVYESPDPEFQKFELVDTLGNEVVVTDTQTITYKAWASCLDWYNRDEGILLYGNYFAAKVYVDVGIAPEAKHASKWVFLDVDNNRQLGTFGDPVSVPMLAPSSEPYSYDYPNGSSSPRGASFDGNSIYTVDMDLNFIQKWNIINPVYDLSLSISDIESFAGTTINIPVVVDSGFSNVAMIDLHIEFDSNLLSYEGMNSSFVTSGDVNEIDGIINIVWIYSGTAMDIPDGDTLIVFNFQVDASATEGQTCRVGFVGGNCIGDPDENAYSLALNPGTFTVISGYGISGSLTYCDNTSPLIGDTLYLSGDMNENTLTDEYGHYSFDLINGSLTLYPGKHDDISDVNGLDLLRLKNKLLGITTLTPYATLAADCNGSGSVDGLDLLRLKNYLLMILVDPPIATWGFTPQQYIYDPIGSDMSNQNFGAFIYGDVNLNWGTASQALAKASDQINTHVSFSNFTLDEQGYLHLSICVDNDVQLGMIDWSISFDTTAFGFERIDADFISENDYRNTGDLIKLVWIYDGEEIAFEKDSRIIDLVLIPIEDQHSGTVGFTGKNYLATANEKPIHAEYESITVNLTMLNLLDDMQIPTETTLYDNYPNPFNPTTQITYYLKEASEVSLSIYNLRGEKVRYYQHTYQSPGFYQVMWNGCDDRGTLVPSGIYFCQLVYEFGIDVKRMVFMK